MTDPRSVSFWLLPAAEHRAYYAELIRQNVARFGGRRFDPHVTLASTDTSLSQAQAVAQEVSHRCPVISLPVVESAYGPSFTRCLFFRLGTSPVIESAARIVFEGCTSTTSPMPDWHLSLLYASLPADMKRNLAILY